MNHELITAETIVVNAPAEKVWQVLTTPELIKEYLHGTETITDWKPGSEIIFQGEYNGQAYRDKGLILENESNRKISYSYWSSFSGLEDKPGNYGTITYTLEPLENGKTSFTWTQRGFRDEKGQQHSQSGMKSFLDQIRGIMER